MIRPGQTFRRTTGRAMVGAALVVVALVGVSCGDDVPSKADFTSELGKVTGGRVTSDLASCVYVHLSKNEPDLLRRAMTTPDLTKAEDDRMTKLLAQCVLARDDSKKKVTTTTTGD